MFFSSPLLFLFPLQLLKITYWVWVSDSKHVACVLRWKLGRRRTVNELLLLPRLERGNFYETAEVISGIILKQTWADPLGWMLVTWYFSTFEALSKMIPLVFFQTWQQSNSHIGFFQAPRTTRAWGTPSGATAVDVFETPEGWILRKADCGFSSWRHSGSAVLSFVFLSRMSAPVVT